MSADQIGPSRLHIPGAPPPGTPQFRHMVVRDAKGNTFAMPFTYMAALDENAAKQIYHVVRQAVTDANRDLIAGLAAMIVAAFQPQPPVAPVDDENPDRLCAATLATGMCNKRRADHAAEEHPFVPGAQMTGEDGVAQLDIEPPPEPEPEPQE